MRAFLLRFSGEAGGGGERKHFSLDRREAKWKRPFEQSEKKGISILPSVGIILFLCIKLFAGSLPPVGGWGGFHQNAE